MTWVDQMRALVSFTKNCGANTGYYDLSWYTETVSPGLFSVPFFMDLDFLPFVIFCLVLAVPNIHDAQRFTSAFKAINLDGRTPSFASLNMDLGWG